MMLIKRRFVVDTTAIISYFSSVFGQTPRLSDNALRIFGNGVMDDSNILLSIPSVVFVEIFDKWFRGNSASDEEFRAKLLSEVYLRLKQCANIEIRELDFEILHEFVNLSDELVNLENRDKIILASSIVLNAPVITSDSKIISYIKKHRVGSFVN